MGNPGHVAKRSRRPLGVIAVITLTAEALISRITSVQVSASRAM